MADKMRPVPFSELLERLFGELRNQKSAFGIREELFYRDEKKNRIKVFTEECTTPLGPAAGPHTQLAQNIITSYLVGARFIELKTVQVMDTLEIAKPCIDARDEGYNVEWSTEYTLPKAFDEYLKAWFIVNMLDMASDPDWKKPSFIFNMSVGYNLEGIKTEKMQKYIDSMIDAGNSPLFEEYKAVLRSYLENELFEGTFLEGKEKNVLRNIDKIRAEISPSVTLSTMHGCPPDEIEAICSYMLTEKKRDTFVKLNPTLLGYDRVREIMDGLGYTYLGLRRESFEHDLQYKDAVGMLKRLSELARRNGRGFGVKLTNTLGSVNDQGVLPGEEMYMSGRALLPISTEVGRRLAGEFDGQLMISYSGGATAFSVKDLFECGIHPITVATDMLKPGGYSRLTQMVNILNSSSAWNMDRIDVEKLASLASKAQDPNEFVAKDVRGTYKAKVSESPLDLFDCYVAPCVEACPIHQMIPDYVALAGEGRLAEALAVIYLDNALPNMTGWICDHQCQNHCARMDYEGPVKIREVKRRLASEAMDEYLKELWEKVEDPDMENKAAVIGAGPSGLAAAYFLSRAGFYTEVFEREESAGGVVRHVIPEFRIPCEVVDKDVAFIERNGVVFNFNTDVTVSSLREKGFKHIFVAVGAEKSTDSRVSGNGRRESAVSMLRRIKKGEDVKLGANVVVIGAGNTAMDASRAAKRIAGVEKVSIVYRRSISEMPADREEYHEALNDGVDFNWLVNPTELKDGVLTLRKMVLGEPDASGRRRPVETEESFTIPCDYLVSAIGEKADDENMRALGAESEEDGLYLIGDVVTGPSTIVECIASARRAVEKAIDSVYEEIMDEDDEDECCSHDHDEEHECCCGGHHHHHDEEHECTCGHHHEEDHECCCGHDHEDDEDEELSEEEREELEKAENLYFKALREKKSNITESADPASKDFFRKEASRCLECSYLCNRCVEVCPNRANVAVDMRAWGAFEDPFQILHLDAYCNECGNCETFCPHQGGPYRRKFTLFSRRDDFENSTNPGFYVENDEITVRIDGEVHVGGFDKEGFVSVEGVPAEALMLIDEVFTSYSYLLGIVEE